MSTATKQGKVGKRRGSKAGHRAALRQIKKTLALPNHMDPDAYVALAGCLDEITRRVIARWIDLTDADRLAKGDVTLKQDAALSGIMSLIPPEEHDNVLTYVDDVLNSYHRVKPKVSAGQ